jgi:tRNA-binding protein
MITVAYFPHSYPDVIFLYFKPALRATRVETFEKISILYHQETLIGINLFQVPTALSKDLHLGLNRTLNDEFFTLISQYIKSLGVPLEIKHSESGFITGLILNKDQHPESDHLFICTVDIGHKTLQIITNSEKVKNNDKVVVATEDSITATGFMIVPGMMMKHMSEGMFCSAATLGLNDQSQVGVMVLPNDTPIGKDYYVIRN